MSAPGTAQVVRTLFAGGTTLLPREIQAEHIRLQRRFFATAHRWSQSMATSADAKEAFKALEDFENRHGIENGRRNG